ncbi:Iron-containing alcohol dehydrogenase [Carpediemonas membranifera]|uniref:Iron-containing alcohol dehydrogenase n=1 Tax=Carpediemonas membranifera TaxID=201153 RepID=A0A8J6DYS0_9EUKA|nr:Iron-containing alcohol dehydrogenase [Carpediemonas membranifera]|eukprot:KAG9389738.1 Iron-containing alcohol dehydrogenase [Carpediemonas membranifera]
MFAPNGSLTGSIFYNPVKLIFGKDSTSKIGEEIASRGFKRVIITMGGASALKNGSYQQSIDSLKANNVEVVAELRDIRANPEVNKVREGVKLARENQAEAILAIGGGSVIDSSKALSLGAFFDGDVWDVPRATPPVSKRLPIFTVLTISATASEMNNGYVLQDDEKQLKVAYMHPDNFPTVSCIDPSFQTGLPWFQTVNGVVDAMVHTLELYAGADGSEETALQLDEGLLRSLVNCGHGLQKDPENYNLRANVAWAATLALNGYSGFSLRGGSWLVHMIEHALSAIDPAVAHGAGLGVLMPAVIEYLATKIGKKEVYDRWAKNVYGVDGYKAGMEAWVKDLKTWGHPTTMGELGFKKEQIPHIAKLVCDVGCPHGFTPEDVAAVIELAF